MFEQPTLSGEYVHFYSGDPAFDQDNPNFDHEKWCETGDPKFLPRRDGGPEPFEFRLRHLNVKQKYWLTQLQHREGVIMAAYYAAALALTSVPFVMVKGERVDELKRVQDGRFSLVCDEHMDAFGTTVIAEIGRRVYQEINGNPL